MEQTDRTSRLTGLEVGADGDTDGRCEEDSQQDQRVVDVVGGDDHDSLPRSDPRIDESLFDAWYQTTNITVGVLFAGVGIHLVSEMGCDI